MLHQPRRPQAGSQRGSLKVIRGRPLARRRTPARARGPWRLRRGSSDSGRSSGLQSLSYRYSRAPRSRSATPPSTAGKQTISSGIQPQPPSPGGSSPTPTHSRGNRLMPPRSQCPTKVPEASRKERTSQPTRAARYLQEPFLYRRYSRCSQKMSTTLR